MKLNEMGRPRISADDNLIVRMNFSIDAPTAREWRKAMQKHGLNGSEEIRRLMVKHIAAIKRTLGDGGG